MYGSHIRPVVKIECHVRGAGVAWRRPPRRTSEVAVVHLLCYRAWRRLVPRAYLKEIGAAGHHHQKGDAIGGYLYEEVADRASHTTLTTIGPTGVIPGSGARFVVRVCED